MIKVYDEDKDYIRFSAKSDEDKKTLKAFQEYLQVVYVETRSETLDLLVRKSKK